LAFGHLNYCHYLASVRRTFKFSSLKQLNQIKSNLADMILGDLYDKIEEISIYSNSSNLQWRAELSDTNLKVDHPRIMSAKFDLIWFSCFREEDLNVRRTDERQVMTIIQMALLYKSKCAQILTGTT
jgi:hypothetical protein